MQSFTYPLLWKFIYRYGNLVITPLLLLYALSLVTLIDKNLIILIPFLLSIFILYFLNKSYINFYKLVPYKIQIDEEKIICTGFLFRDKTVTIYIKDIDSISGGIFEGKYRGLMKVCDGKNKLCIGFFDRLHNSSKLVTLILSKIMLKSLMKKNQRLKSLHLSVL